MKEIKNRRRLPLPLNYGKLFIIDDDLKCNKEALEKFLDGITFMNTCDFSKRVLFGQEIKSNNTIEGYLDEITLVNDIIKHPSSSFNLYQRKRILNMYNGYKYILEKKEISKDNIRELYQILSDGQISKFDLSNMGEYYRNNPVYIFDSVILLKEPDQGIDASLIDEYMNLLIEYINGSNDFTNMTDIFIKSQIIHFYFVYLHPYYDINGRSSRTTAMWYLLNNEAYPYIIFNRAIQLDKIMYYSVIRDGRKYHNATYFLNYMLKNVLIELEKEYELEIIAEKSKYSLNDSEYQTLYYILSMNSLLTYLDYRAFYNRFNNKRKTKEIYKTMLEPLIDKEIIIPGRITKNGNNRLFSLNPKIIELDEKVKDLRLNNKINI